jgi:hypothetical protein
MDILDAYLAKTYGLPAKRKLTLDERRILSTTTQKSLEDGLDRYIRKRFHANHKTPVLDLVGRTLF